MLPKYYVKTPVCLKIKFFHILFVPEVVTRDGFPSLRWHCVNALSFPEDSAPTRKL